MLPPVPPGLSLIHNSKVPPTRWPELSDLTSLDLFGTAVSDISPLAGLKNRRTIYLWRDQQVTVPPAMEQIIRRI